MARKRTPEGEVQAACLEYLQRVRGFFCWRQNCGGVKLPKGGGRTGFYRFTSINGVSDIAGLLPGGRAFYCECKAPGGALTPDQALFIDRVNREGGLAVCVSDVRDLIKALDAEGV